MTKFRYATTRRGRRQETRKSHTFLDAQKLPHTHVYANGRRKRHFPR